MQPNQPTYTGIPQMPAPPPNQYDFIVNTGGRRTSLFGPLASQTARIAAVAGGAVLLLIVAWIFIAILSGSNGVNSGTLVALAQQQTEMARIANLPASANSTQPTQDFASSTYLTMLSQQSTFVSYLSQHGYSLSTDILRASKNPNTDSALNNAKTSGTYDQVFIATLQAQLIAYENALKQAYSGARLTSERTLLQSAYSQAQLLSTQSTQTE